MEEAGWNKRVIEADDDKHTVLFLLSLLFAVYAATNQTHDPEHARHCFSVNLYSQPHSSMEWRKSIGCAVSVVLVLSITLIITLCGTSMFIRERLVKSHPSKPPSLIPHLVPCFHWAIVPTTIFVLIFGCLSHKPWLLEAREPSKLKKDDPVDHLGSALQHQGPAFLVWVVLFL